MDDQEITDLDNQNGSGYTYSASSYSFQASYARYLTANFSFGGSIKYIGEEIYREKASGFAFDFGTLLNTGLNSLRLGMSISNMGPEMKFDGPDLDVGYDIDPTDPHQADYNSGLKTEGYDLPMSFRIGMAYDVPFGAESNLMLAVEAKHPNDNEQQGAIGAEYDWQEKFFLRGGYKINYVEEGFSFGGGLKTPLGEETELCIDYAWVDYGRFESVHRFSASVSF
jgi:hypothetical protein